MQRRPSSLLRRSHNPKCARISRAQGPPIGTYDPKDTIADAPQSDFKASYYAGMRYILIPLSSLRLSAYWLFYNGQRADFRIMSARTDRFRRAFND